MKSNQTLILRLIRRAIGRHAKSFVDAYFDQRCNEFSGCTVRSLAIIGNMDRTLAYYREISFLTVR